MLRHYAIEGSNLSVKDQWMQKLLAGESHIDLAGISGNQGLLFSNVTLEKYIDEEYRHDRYDLPGTLERSIRTFSSGEQKKALLNYLMKKEPGFIVLDNPFDSLDQQSVIDLRAKFIELSGSMPVMQIFKRRVDLLPFITDILIVENSELKQSFTLKEFEAKQGHRDTGVLLAEIPGSLLSFDNIPDTLIEMRNISVNYDDKPILNKINWVVRKGEFWQLTGPNGSGKSTLLSMIYGDNPKAYGADLTLFGRKKGSGESIWDIRKKTGYFAPSMTELFHRRNSLEQMVVSGFLDSVGLYRKATPLQLNIAGRWLKALDLFEEREKPFTKVSQVHQRMVLIARAMVKHPPLLILDEPSTGLDDQSAAMLTQLINKVSRESHTAIIYVSHRREEGLQPEYVYTLRPTPSGSIGSSGK
jgi:molybdate transport system ATP-binding protein